MNVKKIRISLLVILIASMVFLPKTFAISEIIQSGDDFLNSGGTEEVVNETKLEEVNSKIYNILLMCGIAVAVIVGAILGITFIMSSAEGKAKVSETLVPYIIGCVVVFGAFTIWKIVVDVGNEVEQSVSAEEETKTICPNCKKQYKNAPKQCSCGYRMIK